MEILRIGICDDEKNWLQKACEMIGRYAKNMGYGIEIVSFQSQDDILTYDGDVPEAVFMDIELKDGNGIQTVSLLNRKWKECMIVYVTNYLFYATDAYETEHIYFVLKEEFEKRLGAVFDKILDMRKRTEKKWRFKVIGGAAREVLLSSEEIFYFERDKRRTKIHTDCGIYEIWEKIVDLENVLSQKEFVRCHNSYIIYLPAIREISSNNVMMKNGVEIPVSRFYAAKMKKKFAEWAIEEVI